MMVTNRKLNAGQPGTKKWVEKYGDRFLCLRYKYDIATEKKYKTIELIVEEKVWKNDREKPHPEKIVKIRVDYGEVELGKQIRSLGGCWHRENKCWTIAYRHVVALGLEDRLI